MALSTFVFTTITTVHFQNYFIVSKRNVYPLNNNFPCLLPPALVISTLLFVSINWPILSTDINEVTQYLIFLCLQALVFNILIVNDKLRAHKTAFTNLLSRPALVARLLCCSCFNARARRKEEFHVTTYLVGDSLNSVSVIDKIRHEFVH